MTLTCPISEPVESSVLVPGPTQLKVLLPLLLQAPGALGPRAEFLSDAYLTNLAVPISKEKLLSDWRRDRHMVLKNLGLEHEREDPAGFNALMSTVRGQMDVARLELN